MWCRFRRLGLEAALRSPDASPRPRLGHLGLVGQRLGLSSAVGLEGLLHITDNLVAVTRR